MIIIPGNVNSCTPKLASDLHAGHFLMCNAMRHVLQTRCFFSTLTQFGLYVLPTLVLQTTHSNSTLSTSCVKLYKSLSVIF